MITPAPDVASNSLGVSPISRNSKHQMTPLKTRRKTSRKDQAADVHTACSTPNRFKSGTSRITFNSPSDSFPCSQENYPDVIWDYTSPILPKGAKKREIKITVEEFLKSFSHNKGPECNTQNSQYIKLLEKWMAKQNTPVCVKKPNRIVKRDHKMRSRRVFEEIKQFMESIQQKKEKAEGDIGEEDRSESNLQKSESPHQLNTSVDKKSLLEGDNNENDSIDELWGEADNSFIVKATQHLDVSCFKYDAQNKNLELMSTIPETVTNTCNNEPKNTNDEAEQSAESNFLNKAILDSDYQAQILLTQIMSCDWDSDSDFGDLENGFIMGDEDLSLIPDEVLCGAEADNKFSKESERIEQRCNDENLNVKSQDNSNSTKQSNVNKSPEITFGGSGSNSCQTANMSEIELFNNFEDGFDDELILSKPEVLSWMDEVETKLSQSQKCTPEEIEKKKDEAIQRRKKNLSKRKS